MWESLDVLTYFGTKWMKVGIVVISKFENRTESYNWI